MGDVQPPGGCPRGAQSFGGSPGAVSPEADGAEEPSPSTAQGRLSGVSTSDGESRCLHEKRAKAPGTVSNTAEL